MGADMFDIIGSGIAGLLVAARLASHLGVEPQRDHLPLRLRKLDYMKFYCRDPRSF